MKSSILSLFLPFFPLSNKEWKEFLFDLSPLWGFFIFKTSNQEILLPLIPEFYLILFFSFLRLLSYGFFELLRWFSLLKSDFSSILPKFQNNTQFIISLFILTILGLPLFLVISFALICVLLLLLGFNFTSYLFGELFFSVVLGGDFSTSFWNIFISLNFQEKAFLIIIFLISLARHTPRMIHFFRDKIFLNHEKSYSWLVLGISPFPASNELLNSFRLHPFYDYLKKDKLGDLFFIGLWFFFPFYFGSLIVALLLPMSGPFIILLLKALLEMYFNRLYTISEKK